jgi:mycothiol system anti-sigma-R factor
MNCAEFRDLIDSYVDGELAPSRNHDVQEHLQSCAACAALHESSLALKKSVRAAKFSAPDDLRARIQTELRRSQVAAAPVRSRTSGPWLLTGLAIAASFLVGFFVAQTLSHRSAEQTLLAQLTDNHVRSLLGTHLIDVASSDQHTVRPWFEGKLDFAPPVEDLTSRGFPLVGGRVEYISGRPVAALVYQRRKHFINLFIWPAATGAEKITASPAQRGYNILHWRSNGMHYWAVSEIATDDLRKFAAAFAEAVAPSS